MSTPRVIYNCLICNGVVSTDGEFTCTCEDGPTAPPLDPEPTKNLAGNGGGHPRPIRKNRLEM
jgi:hypothetical protein